MSMPIIKIECKTWAGVNVYTFWSNEELLYWIKTVWGLEWWRRVPLEYELTNTRL
jgi:hypothetical protein